QPGADRPVRAVPAAQRHRAPDRLCRHRRARRYRQRRRRAQPGRPRAAPGPARRSGPGRVVRRGPGGRAPAPDDPGTGPARRQRAAPTVATTVGTALETHQVPAERLVLEVTEAALGNDTEHAVDQLTSLRTLGVRTALTRFGTGTTPLAHLRRLPVDLLKVDRTLFTEPAGRTTPATPILDVVVGLGRKLGVEV